MADKTVLVAGGRTWGEREPHAQTGEELNPIWREQRALVNSALCFVTLWWPSMELIHGDCGTGADRWAEEWWIMIGRRLEVTRTRYPAEWGRYGRAAGPFRNQTMAERKPDLVILLPGTAGTADMKARAQRAQLYTVEIGHGPVEQWREGLSELIALGKTSRRAASGGVR